MLQLSALATKRFTRKLLNSRFPFDKRSWTPSEAVIMGDEVTMGAGPHSIATFTTTDDMSVMTTLTAVGANSTVKHNNSKRTKSSLMVPSSNVPCTVHGSVGQAQVSLLSARGPESATHTVGYLDGR
jgi:hypothetical protein